MSSQEAKRCGCRSQAECLPYAQGDPGCRHDELPPTQRCGGSGFIPDSRVSCDGCPDCQVEPAREWHGFPIRTDPTMGPGQARVEPAPPANRTEGPFEPLPPREGSIANPAPMPTEGEMERFSFDDAAADAGMLDDDDLSELERCRQERDEARSAIRLETARRNHARAHATRLEAAIREAGVPLVRADDHEFRGTNAEGGDAHALVRQVRAILNRALASGEEE